MKLFFIIKHKFLSDHTIKNNISHVLFNSKYGNDIHEH